MAIRADWGVGSKRIRRPEFGGVVATGFRPAICEWTSAVPRYCTAWWTALDLRETWPLFLARRKKTNRFARIRTALRSSTDYPGRSNGRRTRDRKSTRLELQSPDHLVC